MLSPQALRQHHPVIWVFELNKQGVTILLLMGEGVRVKPGSLTLLLCLSAAASAVHLAPQPVTGLLPPVVALWADAATDSQGYLWQSAMRRWRYDQQTGEGK